MKLLQLTKKFPSPVKDGESLAITNLSGALVDLGCRVDLLAMNTSRHPADLSAKHPALGHYRHVRAVEVDTGLKAKEAFLNLFRSDSYHISRFISRAYDAELRKMLRAYKYDVVQLETLYLAPYIPTIRRHSKARIIMRSHNLEHEIWERISENTPIGLKKWYLNHLAAKLRRYETACLNDYDLLAAITPRDLERHRALGFQREGVSIPIGVAASDYVPDYAAFGRPPGLSFIGSLDWRPNIEGLKWFLDNIWAEAHRRHPAMKLHVAGRNCPKWLRDIQLPNVHVVGEVEDARAFINEHSVMLVPLLSGSGMRVKILEAMALGRVVVTTRIGVEGIPVTHGEHALLADTPGQFLTAFRYVNEHARRLEHVGRNARRLVETRFDRCRIARDWLDAVDDVPLRQ